MQNARRVVLPALILFVYACTPSPETPPTEGDVDWAVYLGDSGRQHFSPLTQITRDNVEQLAEAWVYRSGEPAGTMYTSPLIVDGILYGLSPQLVAFALNAATGEELWRFDPELRGAQRGLMYWERGEDRRIFYNAGKILFGLNAADGKPVESFGEQGRLDVTPREVERTGYLAVTAPGVVFEDKLILGFTTTENADSFPGSVRAFSAVDGSLVWQFDTIPKPGDPGSETWAPGALEKVGGANVWTGMALDEQRGILFAPTGSATPDFYGASRLGDNLFANSLVAINARTGKRIWHYQVIRHDLWDRDNPSPPTLVRLVRDGRTIDAVALTTKSGHLYAFDRETGELMYPIEYESTLPSTLPGEMPAPLQPVSTVTISRQQFEITNRSEEARQSVQAKIKDWDQRKWAPPRVGTVLFYPWYDGGAEWGGSAFDPATNRLIVNSNDVAGVLNLTEIPAGFSAYGTYATHCGSCHGMELEGTETGPELNGILERMSYADVGKVIEEGSGRMPGFAHLSDLERERVRGYIVRPKRVKDEPTKEIGYAHCCYVYLRDHEQLPGNTPPWGTLNSIDLATGETVWRVPFGNFPTHPDLGFGAVSYGGPVVTATGLIFIAATPDRKFRAYDSDNGEVLWEADLTAAGFSTPAVYSVDGKQYVVIAAGGARQGPPSGSEYFAFSLPD